MDNGFIDVIKIENGFRDLNPDDLRYANLTVHVVYYSHKYRTSLVAEVCI